MEKCIICESTNVKTLKAVISDFLLERIWENKRDKHTTIIHCQNCGFSFWKLRPTEEEMEKLYAGYRNEYYQKQRQKYESWYSKEINDFNGNDEAYRVNQNHMDRVFSENAIEPSAIHSVLDYGGDTGLNIPRGLQNATKYVFDISGVRPAKGVIGIDSFDELMQKRFDFVMCQSVLEHVTNPIHIVRNISTLAANGIVLLEVPYDSPFVKIKRNYLQFLFDKRFTMKQLFERALLMLKNPYRMHEHINFFTPKALEYMMEKEGWEVMDVRIENMKGNLGQGHIISAVARVPGKKG